MDIFRSQSQSTIHASKIDLSKKINDDKNFQLKKHRFDSIAAVWEKMKLEAAKRKNIPVREKTDSTENENQEEVEETNLTSQ